MGWCRQENSHSAMKFPENFCNEVLRTCLQCGAVVVSSGSKSFRKQDRSLLSLNRVVVLRI